jgi:fatty-acyl-CoA synthase
MIDVIEKMGIQGICQSYGMSEDGLTSCTIPGDPPAVHASSIGVPIACLEYKIVDPQTGEELGVGREGELCHRGPIVTAGYYKKPEETAKAIDREGWLHSGDLAVKDERGYYRITGRAKDIFIVGGENVAPAEVESFLFSHPKVKQAYVVGVPDQRLGDVPMAFVELKLGETASEQEIVDYCKGRIANFKIPRYVKFVTEFPTTASGKIQKFKLRETAIAELSLG